MNAVTPRFNVVARNWIKLGLKRPLSFAAGSLCAARNWIKLGLKRSPSRVVAICISSRNWIKLGLKLGKQPDCRGDNDLSQLD